MLDNVLGNFNFGGFFSVITTIFYGLLIGGSVVGAYFLYNRNQNWNISIVGYRLLSNGNKQFFYSKAKEVKDKNGVITWRIKGLKHNSEVPSEECVDFDLKGKKVATCCVDNNKQLTWIKTTIVLDEEVKMKIGYEPISTESRANFAYQQKTNEEFNIGSFMDKHGSAVVGGVTLIIILTMVFLFQGRLVEPYIEAQENSIEQKQIDLQIVQLLQDIKEDRDTLDNLATENNQQSAGAST